MNINIVNQNFDLFNNLSNIIKKETLDSNNIYILTYNVFYAAILGDEKLMNHCNINSNNICAKNIANIILNGHRPILNVDTLDFILLQEITKDQWMYLYKYLDKEDKQFNLKYNIIKRDSLPKSGNITLYNKIKYKFISKKYTYWINKNYKNSDPRFIYYNLFKRNSDNKYFLVINLWFPHEQTRVYKSYSNIIENVKNYMSKYKNLNIIIGGDFNYKPKKKDIKNISNNIFYTIDDIKIDIKTCCFNNLSYWSDFIFTSISNNIKYFIPDIRKYYINKVNNNYYASDHLPLYCIIKEN